MTTLKEAPPCPSCGSVACYIQSENFCRHTREVRPAFTQTDEGEAAFDARIDADRHQVSALVLENQAARPLRDSQGRAFCQHEVDGIKCALLMGHDKGEEPVDHILGPEDDDRDEDEKQDDDDDGDTSEDGRLRDESKGVDNAPNKQVTGRKPKQSVTTK